MCGRPYVHFDPICVKITWRKVKTGWLKRLLGLDQLWPEYELTRDWHCQYYYRHFCVPRGFKFDGASIPRYRIVRGIAAFFQLGQVRTLCGGCLHDWLYTLPEKRADYPNLKYEESCLTRRDADQLMRESFAHFGIGPVARWGAWGLVRTFGRARYRDSSHTD